MNLGPDRKVPPPASSGLAWVVVVLLVVGWVWLLLVLLPGRARALSADPTVEAKNGQVTILETGEVLNWIEARPLINTNRPTPGGACLYAVNGMLSAKRCSLTMTPTAPRQTTTAVTAD